MKSDKPWWTVKVWYDRKRDCLSSDAAFVLAKRLNSIRPELKITPLESAHLLLPVLLADPRIKELIGNDGSLKAE